MDMTIWLSYFTHALAEQLQEIKSKGEVVIQIDKITKQYQLPDRQTKLLRCLFEQLELTIKDFEQIFIDIPRRSLQRDLKDLVDKKLAVMEGSTNQAAYKLAPNLRQTCAKS